MTTTSRPELTTVVDHHGNRRFAKPGATRQGDQRPIKQCARCHGYVVFVESAAGRWYLADCFESNTGSFYYRKDQPHSTSCDRRAQEGSTDVDTQDIAARRGEALIAWGDEMHAAGITITDEMRKARIQQIKDEIA